MEYFFCRIKLQYHGAYSVIGAIELPYPITRLSVSCFLNNVSFNFITIPEFLDYPIMDTCQEQ